MTELKPIIAKNIMSLRQAAQMTQGDLAQKLNYSDKAVSKWERAESVPDIMVLKEIADLFGVTVDYLIQEHEGVFEAHNLEEEPQKPRHSRPIITTLSVLLVWFLALFAYVVVDSMPENYTLHWLAFVYAAPISMVVWLVLNSIWFDSKWNYVIISVLMWSGIGSVLLTLHLLDISLWTPLLLGVMGQVGIILWSKMRTK
jgi:transcriptional regulator with XRE-family HTH domain